jgi:hypothetical protein
MRKKYPGLGINSTRFKHVVAVPEIFLYIIRYTSGEFHPHIFNSLFKLLPPALTPVMPFPGLFPVLGKVFVLSALKRKWQKRPRATEQNPRGYSLK